MKKQNETKYIYAFSLIPIIGSSTFQKISKGFPDFKTAWHSNLSDFIKQTRLREDSAQKIFTLKEKINPEQEWNKFETTGLKLVVFKDINYPKRLREIKTAPFVLFCLGNNLTLLQEKQLAIVGARKNSAYGQMATQS